LKALVNQVFGGKLAELGDYDDDEEEEQSAGLSAMLNLLRAGLRA
jgi:hypothetical protein